jgi:hypothetical protein
MLLKRIYLLGSSLETKQADADDISKFSSYTYSGTSDGSQPSMPFPQEKHAAMSAAERGGW